MSAVEMYIPRGLRLEVEEHFVTSPLRGASKRTGLVTARLYPEAARVTNANETDVDLTITGQRDRVEAVLRAVIGGMSA